MDIYQTVFDRCKSIFNRLASTKKLYSINVFTKYSDALVVGYRLLFRKANYSQLLAIFLSGKGLILSLHNNRQRIRIFVIKIKSQSTGIWYMEICTEMY